jgi:hypothetical protein
VRVAALATLIPILLLLNCGYVGPVVPPSPQLPNPVTDLTVVERGDQIVVSFSTPPRTTDNLPIKQFSTIDLRVGPTVTPFDFDRWSASAKRYEVAPPEPNDPDNPRPNAMSKSIPVPEWVGKRVAVAVRTAVKRKDHYSPWSNRAVLQVIPPLTPPAIKLQSTAQGVRITWATEGERIEYRVFRQGPGDTAPLEIGTSGKPEYLDTTSQYDTRYEYSVVAAEGQAESLPSESVAVTPIDIFPPSVPAGVTALVTPEGIELSWQRSPESDLKGYYVYRSVSGGSFVRQNGLINLPTYSDRDVKHGDTYRYEITAVDQKNNESDKSAAAEAAF